MGHLTVCHRYAGRPFGTGRRSRAAKGTGGEDYLDKFQITTPKPSAANIRYRKSIILTPLYDAAVINVEHVEYLQKPPKAQQK
ncbi:hypothetical protein A3850_005310 [Lewinella sp. 4G2]|nr:hypothetical protein A3850_005310 [Lewinella sp. 4G2]